MPDVRPDLSLMVADSAPKRAEQYRLEAAKFRRIAETETRDELRDELLELADRYDKLAASADVRN